MSERTFRAALGWAAFTGTLIAAVMCVLFGVLDVQCRGDKAGPYWNADSQQCQAHEVSPTPDSGDRRDGE